MLRIRPAKDEDRDAIWEIFHEVIAAGETYPIDRDFPREDALGYWFQSGAHVYVAELDGLKPSSLTEPQGTREMAEFKDDGLKPSSSAALRRVVGSYTLHPNQSGGGAHVANAAFIVAKNSRGHGIGRALGEHCLKEARRLGFRAMQFNYVVSTNVSAVKLWQELGMKIVGTLPGAFRHPEKGFVDVYVMYQEL